MTIRIGNSILSTSAPIFSDISNRDLSNLTSTGEKHFLNKQQVTNCLLEVPQNIKLELTDGVLTLKAGSKVIVPNGADVFDEVVIESDLTKEMTIAGKWFICYDATLQALRIRAISESYSGNTTPTSTTNAYWYDTTNNKIGVSGNNGTTWSYNQSLPLCTVTTNGTQISSIDQVFNGLGYIGSTIWVDKGIKGLAPGGRNTDGTYKNIEIVVDKVYVQTTSTATANGVLAVTPGGLANGKIYLVDYNTYTFSEEEPTTLRWYKPSTNRFYIKKDGVWDIDTQLHVAFFTKTSTQITSFNPKLPFRAVDYNDYTKDLDTKVDKTDLDTKVNKSGDTITGELIGISSAYPFIAQSNIMDITTTPSTNQYVGCDFRDKNGVRVGWAGVVNVSDGRKIFQIQNNGGVDGFNFPMCIRKATTTSSASNIKVAVITQNYVNGTSWYRVWSDGWIEQGGYKNGKGDVSIALLKNFTNTNYQAQMTPAYSTFLESSPVIKTSDKTTSAFMVYTVFDYAFYWYACGY